MTKRHAQESCCNGLIVMDGENSIHRCADCSQGKICEIAKKWKWFHGPLPQDCPLPKAVREEDEPDAVTGGDAETRR